MSLRDKIEALPETEATGSRDFGRGYAKAIKDVLALMSQREGDLAQEARKYDEGLSRSEWVGSTFVSAVLHREAAASSRMDREGDGQTFSFPVEPVIFTKE